jgi:hypothetical protein
VILTYHSSVPLKEVIDCLQGNLSQDRQNTLDLNRHLPSKRTANDFTVLTAVVMKIRLLGLYAVPL